MGLKKSSRKKKDKHDARRHGKARCEDVLRIINSDTTFYVGYTDPLIYVGRCIHCNTMLTTSMSGQTDATIEHIVPLSAGGSGTDLANLALACEKCNNEKGVHHDPHYGRSEHSTNVINALLEKRKKTLK